MARTKQQQCEQYFRRPQITLVHKFSHLSGMAVGEGFRLTAVSHVTFWERSSAFDARRRPKTVHQIHYLVAISVPKPVQCL